MFCFIESYNKGVLLFTQKINIIKLRQIILCQCISELLFPPMFPNCFFCYSSCLIIVYYDDIFGYC